MDEETYRDIAPALTGIPGNPVPKGALVSFVTTPDHVRLRAAVWPARTGQPRGTVCLFQGRSEFIEKYFEVVEELLERGFSVATLDWRGQGGSQRLARNPVGGHVRNFADYDTDLTSFVRDVVLPDCPAPYYALAHSMGGLILLRNATIKGIWFERAVCTAPLIDMPNSAVPWDFAFSLARTFKRMGLGRMMIPRFIYENFYNPARSFPGNPLTRDAARFARMLDIVEADPGLGIGPPTFGWMAALSHALDDIASERFHKNLQLPVLNIAAGMDTFVSTPAIEQLGKRMRIGGTIVLDGSRHEIMMEDDRIRERFWAAFDSFIPGTKA
ncbi:alpha/beta fold hydrolase [Tepidamorphus sp. 3E244]|uniref:alpha/beta fold hydrolase n=1 Tax=Tepidamorphus sp. 3E244 TaxID=3385498 RepID=UPI0038FBFA41